ncbi:hypothetical protein [Shouchella miscanthi]|uniref:hypothetical protein n=1 Tax=Shouchella miscanthi TaxID=2598861 RepID=UPI00119CDBA1|nr:hypothetical protein [Shouchella miscanthi]
MTTQSLSTQPLIDFNKAQMSVVYEAMERYIEKLEGGNKKLFRITLVKVLNEGNEVRLDGMGMRQINQALAQRAKLHYAFDQSSAGKAKWRIVAQLANVMLIKMHKFQQDNSPLNRKEAQTAVTVHASVAN